MEKTIYLHIGVPKSGSSTIANGLAKNKKALLEQGYLFPSAGIRGTRHKNIFFELTSLDEHKVKFLPEKGGIRAVAEEINKSKAHSSIVSSEALSLLRPSEIDKLLSEFKKFQTKVIVYLRRQDHVIQSGWSQNIKRLVINNTLDQNIENELSNHKSVYHYEYLLDVWASKLGKENLIVRVLEKNQLAEGHVFYDFLRSCGINDVKSFDLPKSANVAPSARILGVILEISKFLDFKALTIPERIEIGRAIENFGMAKGWGELEKHNQIDTRRFNKIMAHFESGNNKVASKYLSREKLFTEDFLEKDQTSFSIDEIHSQDLIELFAYTFNVIIPKLKERERTFQEAVLDAN